MIDGGGSKAQNYQSHLLHLRALQLGILPLHLRGRVRYVEADEHVALLDAVALGAGNLRDSRRLWRNHHELRARRRVDEAGGVDHAADGAGHRQLGLHGDRRRGLNFLGRRLAARRA